MWYNESVFYQIYPLGFCGAPFSNDGVTESRIKKVSEWVPHIKEIGANAIYFSPIFDSDSHGYDTRDYAKIDCRLGTNKDFAELCDELHANNINVVLDGVFNHVGRGFWAFKDVCEKKWDSPYKDWFRIDFNGNSNYNDGFWYDGWEGHYELVKLNLQNNDVVNYLLNCVKGWIDEFKIDGIRLDVAYSLDENFVRRLHDFTKQIRPDFFLLGEMLHGDYNRLVNDAMLDSATNYECYKGIYSAFNSMNMFEIAHSINRQFGNEQWCIYRGKHMFTFADNHDVTRIATILTDKNHLQPVYGLVFSMPGIPCVYYGSEWGAEGDKKNGDGDLRQCYDKPIDNELSEFVSKIAAAHKSSKALCYGGYRMVLLTNHQFIFERSFEDERVLVAINAADYEFDAHFDAQAGCATDLITGEYHDFGGGSKLAPYSIAYWKVQ